MLSRLTCPSPKPPLCRLGPVSTPKWEGGCTLAGGRRSWGWVVGGGIGEAELARLSARHGARAAEPQTKGKIVVWLSAGLGLVRCGLRALSCQPSPVTGWDSSSFSHHVGSSCGQWRKRPLEGNFSTPSRAPPRCDGWFVVGEANASAWPLSAEVPLFSIFASSSSCGDPIYKSL